MYVQAQWPGEAREETCKSRGLAVNQNLMCDGRAPFMGGGGFT